MRLNTYLNYGGNCAEAFRFYEEHLGGKIGMMMKHGDMPDPSKVMGTLLPCPGIAFTACPGFSGPR